MVSSSKRDAHMIERSGSGGPPGHQAGPGGDKHKQVTGPPPLQEGASLGPGEPHTPPLLPSTDRHGSQAAVCLHSGRSRAGDHCGISILQGMPRGGNCRLRHVKVMTRTCWNSCTDLQTPDGPLRGPTTPAESETPLEAQSRPDHSPLPSYRD